MARYISTVVLLVILGELLVSGCLITNCPKGGKRNGKFGIAEGNIKPCVSCGPGHSGQCFGPNICCGPFGCHLGTQDSVRCQREGMFHEREPCIAGNAFCRRNTGRCAGEGICCTQDSCYIDKACTSDDKPRISITDIGPLDFFPLVNYPIEYSNEK